MAAPTLVSYTQTLFTTGANGAFTTASITVQINDIVLVMYGDEGLSENFLDATTTISGLSFTRSIFDEGNGSHCGAAVWYGTATANGSGTVTCSRTSGSHSICGLFVYRGSTGIGNVAGPQDTTTKTLSLTPQQAHSAIVYCFYDFGAAVTGTVSPAGTSHSISSPGPAALPYGNRDTGRYTVYQNVLDDQASTGATSYGLSSGGGTGVYTFTIVEVKGTLPPAATPNNGPRFQNAVQRAARR